MVKRRAWNSRYFKNLRVGCLCGLKNSYSQQCRTQWHTAETKGFNITTRLATKDFKVSNGWINSFKPLRTKRNTSSHHAVHTCHPGYKNQWLNAVCCKIHTKHILAFCCINRLTLTSKHCILYIYSTNIGTEYFKRGLYSPFFSLQNTFCFIMLMCLVPVLFTFYTQGVLKLKKNNSSAKGLIFIGLVFKFKHYGL